MGPSPFHLRQRTIGRRIGFQLKICFSLNLLYFSFSLFSSSSTSTSLPLPVSTIPNFTIPSLISYFPSSYASYGSVASE
jgi:hypothetical protein